MGRFADTAHRVLSRKMQRDQMDMQAADADANRALQYASMGQQELARGMNNQDALRRVKELAASQQAQETIQANARMHGDNQQLEGIRVKSVADRDVQGIKSAADIQKEHLSNAGALQRENVKGNYGQENQANELAFKYTELDARKGMNTEDNNRARANANTIANAASKNPELLALMRDVGDITEDIRNASSVGKTGQGAYGAEKDAKGRDVNAILSASAAQLIDRLTQIAMINNRGMPYETARAQAVERANQILDVPAAGQPRPVDTKRIQTQE